MHGGQRVGAGAAVLLGDVRGVEVGGPQRVVGRLRELAGLVDLGGVRGDLAVADLTDRLAERLVLLGPVDVERRVDSRPPYRRQSCATADRDEIDRRDLPRVGSATARDGA